MSPISTLRFLRGWLRACWCVPGVEGAQAAVFRGQQFRATAALMPQGSLCALVLVGIALGLHPRLAQEPLVFGCALVLCSFALANLWIWRVWKDKPADTPVSARSAWLLALSTGTIGVAYSVLALRLFDAGDDPARTAIVAVLAAVISTGGWITASLPQVGLVWTAATCGACMIGIGLGHGARYGALVPMLGLYGGVLALTVLLSARQFIGRLQAEYLLKRQKETIGLLLNDFEEGASDWLWETDRDGRLTHVSVRLAEATGSTVDALSGRLLADVLATLLPPANEPAQDACRQLTGQLHGDTAFRELTVPVTLGGEQRWWSFAAKPLRDPVGQITGWRGVVSDVTVIRERNEELMRQANLDSLTGLGNRHFFHRRLARCFRDPRNPQPCALFVLDLDNFKNVNDSLGHAAGDQLLRHVARRLRRQTPREAVLARLGGDEFALILPGDYERARLERFGQRLQGALQESCVIDGHRIDIHASIGVAHAPRDASNAEDLLKVADMALYAAKAAGRRTLRFFERHLEVDAREKLSLLADLGVALRDGQLDVYYQPQIRLQDGALVGFEALVRWQHPTRGMVPPVQFIALAEDSGLIVPLGRWVLERACRDAKSWPADKRVAVNVSAVEFERTDIRRVVREVLEITGLPVARLELELTESSLLADAATATRTLQGLRKDGLRIALDDFGTGFSSLAYLRRLPLDKLKIDRSFVRPLAQATDAQSTAIVHTIVDLGRAMNLETIAEGVETPAQERALRDLGCAYGQGYLFAKPMNAQQTLEFIDAYENDDLDLAETIAQLRAPQPVPDSDLRVDDLRSTLSRTMSLQRRPPSISERPRATVPANV